MSTRPTEVPGLDLHSDTASSVCPSERLATAQIYPEDTSRFKGYTDRLHHADKAFLDDSAVPLDAGKGYPFESGSLVHQPGAPRGQIRRLHQSSVFQAMQKTNDPTVDTRVKFTGRLITSRDADALREMTGFFMPSDGSIAVYEYKKLNKSTNKTFPFIPRKQHSHTAGRKAGQGYSLTDIYAGAVLSFDCTQLTGLPDTVKASGVCFLRVSEVDNTAKKDVLLSRAPSSEWQTKWKALHTGSLEEQEDYRILKALQQKVQKSFGRRNSLALLSLYRSVQAANKGKDKESVLDPEQFLFLTKSAHLDISPEECLVYADLFACLFGEPIDSKLFLTFFLGGMREERKKLVLKAFLRMDTEKKGQVNRSVLEKFFNPKCSDAILGAVNNTSDLLQLMRGELSREQRREESAAARSGRSTRADQIGVTLTEFELFHEWVSLKVESDDQFEGLMEEWWGYH